MLMFPIPNPTMQTTFHPTDSLLNDVPDVLDIPDDDSFSFSFSSHLNNYDPDLNLDVPTPLSCNYYLPYDFNALVSRNQSLKNTLSFLNMNVRSLPSNFTFLQAFLANLIVQFKVLCLTETWLKDHNHTSYNLPDYNMLSVFRPHRPGGGVSLLIHESVRYKHRADLDLVADHCECIFAEIHLPDSPLTASPILIGALYRPPNTNFDMFTDALQGMLTMISNERKVVYLMGDFNVHLDKIETDRNAQEFSDIMHSFSLQPLIDKPSRITPTSSSLIDNIFTNQVSDKMHSGLLYTDISDHLVTFALTHDNISFNASNGYLSRDFSESHRNLFTSLLSEQSWNSLFAIDDPSLALDHFLDIITTLYDIAFPLKTKRPRKRRCHPWVTPGIKKSINRKNKLYSKFHKNPTLFNEVTYKAYRRNLNRILRQAKRDFYHSQLQQARDDVKKTWSVLKDLIGTKEARAHVPDSLLINNITVTDPTHMAHEFNQHFSSIGRKVASAVPRSDVSPLSLMHGQFPNSLFFSPVTEPELATCMRGLKRSSAGSDNIRPQELQDNIDLLTAPITHLMNLSLQHGVFPSRLKTANITPIHKGGPTEVTTNYRPISVLTTLSKLLEKLVYRRLIDFFTFNNVLSNSQFGFRKKHSCEMPLILATDFIHHSLDDDYHVLGIYLDLKKAFDVVSHPTLIQKLSFYGVRGVCLNWFSSYLSDRQQRVKLNNSFSSFQSVTHGVPQGSILGPLLFLLYVNDLTLPDDDSRLLLFADDTTLLVRSRNHQCLQTLAQNNLNLIGTWLNANRLACNVSKTHYMIFTLNTAVRASPFHLLLNGETLCPTSSTRFLGVIIDNRLRWDAHINLICSKISKCIGVIRKLNKLLPPTTCLIIYNALILPHLSYCHVVWGNAASIHLQRLSLLLKRAIRAVHHAPYLAHTEPLFNNSNTLPFSKLYTFYSSIFLYKLLHDYLPRSFSISFSLPTAQHSVNTRRNALPYIPSPRYRTAFGQRCLRHSLIKLFNEFILPLDLFQTSLYHFKRNLKSILL